MVCLDGREPKMLSVGKTRVGGEASALLPACSASFQLPPLSCQGPTPTPTFHTLMKKLVR